MKDSKGNRRTNTHNAAFRRLFVGTLTETRSPHTHQPEPAPTGSLGLYSISLSLRSGFANVDHTVMSNPNPSFLVKRGHLLIAAHEVAG
ncbi:MAG: hypothetical protein IKV48_01400, partial [Eggerthellaceae bacterium]|nr:hypothetical protein [Eggerthellaceae bacterium]